MLLQKSTKKIIQEKLQIDSNETESMKMRKMKTIAIEIFKTVNGINLNFIKTIFTFKTNFRVRSFNLLVKNRNAVKYGSKSLMALGPMECTASKYIKKTSISKLKEYVKSWSSPTSKCKMCICIQKLWKFVSYQTSL